MWKLIKNKRALSPVVAAIILIAVTVAVSIAVAAWMGALTFTFMRTEELKIVGLVSWGGANPAQNATITVKNTGTGALTVDSVKVNSGAATLFRYRKPAGSGAYIAVPAGGITLNPGDTADIVVTRTGNFASGTKYQFDFHSATGNNYPYTDTAP